MRKTYDETSSDFRIAVLDDEIGVIDSVSVVLKRMGYGFAGFTDPQEALKDIRSNHYDMLILDYLMDSMRGDEVVAKIREFNSEIYILLLTGHKDLAPPLETIRNLEIQGYCEKSDKFDQLILLIESGIKSIIQMKRIKEMETGLSRVLDAIPRMYRLQPIEDIIEQILAGMEALTGSRNVLVEFLPGDSGISGVQAVVKGAGGVEDLEDSQHFPLVNEAGESIGSIYAAGKFSTEQIQILHIYAKHATASLSNAILHNEIKGKNAELERVYEELKRRYVDTVQVLRLAVDAKDVYTRGHSDRVAYYAVKIGETFGLSEKELELLRLGGIFHDVGKLGTADDILFKTESLSRSEYEIIKKHPVNGATILSAVSMFSDVVPLIRHHHERIDGRGYPDGIKDREIPFMARILSVADAFDAMTSDRLYRSKLDLSQAVKQLEDASGAQFDPQVVRNFVKLLDQFEQMKSEISHTFE